MSDVDKAIEKAKELNLELQKTNELLREQSELRKSIHPVIEAQELACAEYVGATKEDITKAVTCILDQLKSIDSKLS